MRLSDFPVADQRHDYWSAAFPSLESPVNLSIIKFNLFPTRYYSWFGQN